jgi:hypothetical protein
MPIVFDNQNSRFIPSSYAGIVAEVWRERDSSVAPPAPPPSSALPDFARAPPPSATFQMSINAADSRIAVWRAAERRAGRGESTTGEAINGFS